MLLTDLTEDTLAHVMVHVDLESGRRCALAHPSLRSVAYARCLNDKEVQNNKMVMHHMKFRTADALVYKMTIRNRDKMLRATYRPYVCGTCDAITSAVGECSKCKLRRKRVPVCTSPLLLWIAVCVEVLHTISYCRLRVGTLWNKGL